MKQMLEETTNQDPDHINNCRLQENLGDVNGKREREFCPDRSNTKRSSIGHSNTGHPIRAGHPICAASCSTMVPRRDSIETIGQTKWLSLKTLHWTDEDGHSRLWDVASRTTKQANVPDAVVIVPILKGKNKPIETLLVKQYRPPIESYTIEFPAGLIDKGETAQEAAIRELYEETGYVGKVDTTFSTMEELCMSPGLCDETIQIVVVDVDLDDPKNVNPNQHLDEGEAITLQRVPLTTGLKHVLDSSKGNNMPISLLYSFAIGLEMGAKYLK
jgi:8-oxo-dGTP pyrophosphatase MutT (NUDIX family)